MIPPSAPAHCTGTHFRRVIGDNLPCPPSQVRRLVLCSGKVYYHMLAHRRARRIQDVALVRLEQLAPFPFDRVASEVELYPNAELVWAQEEPKNMGACRALRALRACACMRIGRALTSLVARTPLRACARARAGAWTYVQPRLHTAMQELCSRPRPVRYVGRTASSVTATGCFSIHRQETEDLLAQALLM